MHRPWFAVWLSNGPRECHAVSVTVVLLHMLSSGTRTKTHRMARASGPCKQNCSAHRCSLRPDLFHRRTWLPEITGTGPTDYIAGSSLLAAPSSSLVKRSAFVLSVFFSTPVVLLFPLQFLTFFSFSFFACQPSSSCSPISLCSSLLSTSAPPPSSPQRCRTMQLSAHRTQTASATRTPSLQHHPTFSSRT
jgi:hypothetical protein